MLMAKNSTSRPYPIAFMASLMVTMVIQMAPPRKLCGVVVIRDHISVILSFQVFMEDCRFPTIQLSLKKFTS